MSNKTQKLCECGCGRPAPIAKRNWHTKGIKKGEPLRFICGHHRRGKAQGKEEKIKRVKAWGIKDVVISPYLPDNKIIRFFKKQKRWYCCVKGYRKPHARMVYEHHHGEIPDGMVVHHKNGSAEHVEDDKIENLMLLPHKWNWRHFPCLSEGFDVSESLVTEFYCEAKEEVPEQELFSEICKKLIQFNKEKS